MNILTYNKEIKEKIQKILNEKKNKKKEATKVELEIEVEKKYANNKENKDIIEDLSNLIFEQDIAMYKFLEIENFLLEENSDDYLTKNLLEILNNSIKESYKENIEYHKVSKIIFPITLIIIIISFFGHYNNWSYSFWNKNIFLLILNVILVILAIVVTLVTYFYLYEINKYNKRYKLKRNNFFEISLGITLLIIGVMHFSFKFLGNTDYSNGYKKVLSYSQPQPQQAVATQSVVENNTERQEVAPQSNTQTINNYDHDLEVLGKVYDEVINRGNESYLENFSSEELAIIRNTLYARKGYQFKKKEYQEYFGQKSWYNPTTTNQNILTKNEERLANIIKGYENNTNTRTSNTSEIGYENKFGRVVKDKYVGGSFIEFLRNADQNEYYYLRDQFWEILDTMYITEDNKTYYYLNDIIDQLETKADWDNSSRVISLEVKGNKMYYTVGFPKGYNANTPSWVQFEIFERKFNDGIGLRTAHVSCAINGVEYKDWEAVNAIFR